MHTIELFEWEKGAQKSQFSDSELRALNILNNSIRRKEKSDAITITYNKIFTYSFVGIIQVGNKRIEILPKLYNPDLNISLQALDQDEKNKINKIARRNLFSLLSYAGMIPTYKTKISKYKEEKDFFEFLISYFLDDLGELLASHFYHEYQIHYADIPRVKGKIRIHQQALKLPSQLHQFSCKYNDFSINNSINRVIKAALRRLQYLSKSEDNKKRAFFFYSMLGEVADENITPSYLSRIHFNRLNECYKGIIEFCSMILFGSIYTMGGGQRHYYALIFDMNLTFEKYITRLLRNSLIDFDFDYQEKIHLASELPAISNYTRNKKQLIPDIIVRRNGEASAIIDTKYKLNLSNGYIKNADLYQMMAYCIAKESDKGLLLYPRLPDQDELKNQELLIVLDKIKKDQKIDRRVNISAKSIQMFDSNGKVRRKLAEEDIDNLLEFFTSSLLLQS